MPGMFRSIEQRIAVLCVALVAMCLIGVGLAVGLASGSLSKQLHPERIIRGGHTPLGAGVVANSARNERVLARRFPALRAAHSSSALPALPSIFVEEILSMDHTDTPQGRIAPNPALARYVGSIEVSALESAMAVWLVPGADGVCIVEVATGATGTTCATDAEAAAGALSGLLDTKSGVTAYGVLPGNSTIATVAQADGSAQTIPVRDGLWVANDDPQAVSLAASTGVRFALPKPPGR